MTTIPLVKAGGEMGCRPTYNFLKHSQYKVRYLEVSEQGIANLAKRNIKVSYKRNVIAGSDDVILASSNVIIGKLSEQIIPQIKSGAL